jgi:hypothetical protein
MPFIERLFFRAGFMKIVAIILILAYLTLPALCLGHPCEPLLENSAQSLVVSDVPGECPFPHDTDDCETTCCCAGHIQPSAGADIPYAGITVLMRQYEPYLALPRLIDRIFVPPQNPA